MGYRIQNNKMIFTIEKKEPVVIDNSLLIKQFEDACVKFRQICSQIGKLIGNQNFQGGFDQMSEFENAPQAQSSEGIILSIKWIAANESCTYLASKLGIGQPDWWYQCWNFIDTEEKIQE